MDVPEELLEKGDVARRHVREHPKALAGNVLGAFVTITAVIVAMVILPDSLYPWAHWAIGLTGTVLIILVLIYPFLQWLTSTYTITDKRLIARSGFLKKTITEVARAEIKNVAIETDVVDKLTKSGSLIATTDSGRTLMFRHVPDVADFRAQLVDVRMQED